MIDDSGFKVGERVWYLWENNGGELSATQTEVLYINRSTRSEFITYGIQAVDWPVFPTDLLETTDQVVGYARSWLEAKREEDNLRCAHDRTVAVASYNRIIEKLKESKKDDN